MEYGCEETRQLMAKCHYGCFFFNVPKFKRSVLTHPNFDVTMIARGNISNVSKVCLSFVSFLNKVLDFLWDWGKAFSVKLRPFNESNVSILITDHSYYKSNFVLIIYFI